MSGDDPQVFEKHMPESNITLSSIIKFSKEPTVKHIADEVIDLDYENGLLVLLKKDKLETNRIDCSSILLKDDRFLSVSISGGLVLVTGGAQSAVIVDIGQCGILHELDSRGGKGFALSDKYLLEFTRNSFEVFDSRRVKKIFGGNFLGSVVMGGRVSGDNLMFANENGKIALMDIKTQKYTAMYPDSIDVQQTYFEGDDVYVYDSDNRLTRLTADYGGGGVLGENGQAQAKEGCFFLKHSGKLFFVTDLYLVLNPLMNHPSELKRVS